MSEVEAEQLSVVNPEQARDLPMRVTGIQANGRYRLHGGCSTGPRTPEGLERCRRANWRHGKFSFEAKAELKAFRARSKWEQQFMDVLGRWEELRQLLFEITGQVDDAGWIEAEMREGDSAMAAVSSRHDRSHVLERDGYKPWRPHRLDELLTAVLEAGAAGCTPEEILKVVQHHKGPHQI